MHKKVIKSQDIDVNCLNCAINNDKINGVKKQSGRKSTFILLGKGEKMNQEAKIKEALLPLLEAQKVTIYDIVWMREGKHKILQISIERNDGSVDVDLCANMAEIISEKLDEIDVIENEYMLEVCSPGAERKLRNENEIKNAVGKYVYAKFKNPVGKLNDVKGTLLSVSENVCCIEYMDKTFKRQVNVQIDNCSLIRLAVKI